MGITGFVSYKIKQSTVDCFNLLLPGMFNCPLFLVSNVYIFNSTRRFYIPLYPYSLLPANMYIVLKSVLNAILFIKLPLNHNPPIYLLTRFFRFETFCLGLSNSITAIQLF